MACKVDQDGSRKGQLTVSLNRPPRPVEAKSDSEGWRSPPRLALVWTDGHRTTPPPARRTWGCHQRLLSSRNKTRSLLAIISVLNYLKARISRIVIPLKLNRTLFLPRLSSLDSIFYLTPAPVASGSDLNPTPPRETQPFVQTFHQTMSDHQSSIKTP